MGERRWRSAYAGLAVGVLLAGCGGGGGGSAPTPPGESTITVGYVPAIASASLTSGSTQQTTTIGPIGAGYSGSVTIPSTLGGTIGSIALTLAASAPGGTPVVSSTARRAEGIGGSLAALIYLTFTPSVALTFTSTPSFTFSGTSVPAGSKAYVGLYDPTNPGWTTFAGPGSAAGSTLTFPAPRAPITFAAGVTYVFAVFITTQTLTVPTPCPACNATANRDRRTFRRQFSQRSAANQIAPTAFSLNGRAVAYGRQLERHGQLHGARHVQRQRQRRATPSRAWRSGRRIAGNGRCAKPSLRARRGPFARAQRPGHAGARR